MIYQKAQASFMYTARSGLCASTVGIFCDHFWGIPSIKALKSLRRFCSVAPSFYIFMIDARASFLFFIKLTLHLSFL